MRGYTATPSASFDELNESTKAQQAFLNSGGAATWNSDEERRAIRWLLSALIDHRRRTAAASTVANR